MAEQSLIYRDQALQPAPVIPGFRDLSTFSTCLEDIMFQAIGRLEGFLEMTSDCAGPEKMMIADIGLELLKNAKREMVENFNLIERHFGTIRIDRFTWGKECRKARVAGDCIGVQVFRNKGGRQEPVLLLEKEAHYV
ncbi:hypothetical protein [Desulfocurvibacter africanus]|uniref:hypothetical protein n=1 Tax=Desulfocurvibacter africanus TaxID=873 RepID=UPI000428C54B|nr:hypothetical protein [Desulfocurvibacter africanus]